LVVEVEIDRALGDAGARRDVVDTGRREAARAELVERRLHDRGAARLALGGAVARRLAGGRLGLAGRRARWRRAVKRPSAAGSPSRIARAHVLGLLASLAPRRSNYD